ncbi:MAG: glycosyltransferase family 4 protein [Kiritimatiellia bacterium]
MTITRVLAVVRWPVGGIRTYLLYNYPFLLEREWRVTFVGPDDETFAAFQEDVKHWPDVEFVAAPVRRFKCDLRRAVAACLRQRSFALVHSQGVTATVHSVLGNLRRRVPHVATIHDLIRPNQFPGVVGRAKRAALARVLTRVNRIIAVSNDARANLLEYLPYLRRFPGKIVTIVNGIDTDRFSPGNTETPFAAGSLRTLLRLKDDVFLMGFSGRFMEQKGFPPLVEALDYLPALSPPRPYHLVAVASGDCTGRYRRAALSRENVAPHISFIDRVADSASILRQLDLLVMPSLWEACPLLPMEAMCAGTPVLGSDCIGLREVLAQTPSRIVPAGDSAALAHAMRDAIEKPWDQETQRYAPVACARFSVGPKARELYDVLITASRAL